MAVPTPTEFWFLNNTLTGTGGRTLVSADGQPHFGTGKIGQGWDANRDVTRRLSITDATLNPFGISWSVSFWLKDNLDPALPMTPWNFYSGPTTVSRCAIAASGAITFTAGTSPVATAAAGAFNGNWAWKHVVCVFNFGQLGAIYVNNVKTAGTIVRTVPSLSPLSFSLNYAASTGLTGNVTAIDSVGYWRQALSDAEVAELYNSGSGWEPATYATLIVNSGPNAGKYIVLQTG
jgi:hypothetical protein